MNPAVAAIPANAVLIHIGPHKTGTTSLQAKLASARQQLREHGVVYPGPRGAHHAEARAFIRRPEGFAGDHKPLETKAWKRLARIARETDGTVALSSEFFALSTAEDRARLAEDFDVDQVHLLVAARNPGLLALSSWQQSVSSGNTRPAADWLEERFRRDQPGVGGSDFWAWADAATLVAGWSEVIDPRRIHVVVLDESDRALMPASMEQLLGLPPGLIADQPTEAHNRSLTAPEAELVRTTSVMVKDELSWAEFSLFFRQGVGRRLLYTRSPAPDEARSVLPGWAAAQAAAEAESIAARLLGSGARIIGDLDNLRNPPPSAEGSAITEVPVELAAHAVAGVMTAARLRLRRSEERIKELEDELAEVTRSQAPAAQGSATPLYRRAAARAKRALSPPANDR